MKSIVIDTLRRQGKASALALREKAPAMTGTELIAEEGFVPDFDPAKDYSAWTAGSPVQDEGQVWTDGFVYRCIAPQPTEYTPESYPTYWERVEE